MLFPSNAFVLQSLHEVVVYSSLKKMNTIGTIKVYLGRQEILNQYMPCMSLNKERALGVFGNSMTYISIHTRSHSCQFLSLNVKAMPSIFKGTTGYRLFSSSL